MIAASSTGTSFGALGAYLVGDESRVGWAEAWNVMEQTPRAAAVAMKRHVELSESRVKRPVYHVAIAFDPDDRPTEAEIRNAAKQTLRDLGLDGHQALVVRHTDQAHAHVHLMVNRVGPDGRAWSTSHERRRLRASMERQERELGTRWTGRNADLARPPRATPSDAPRTRDRGFAADVRSRSLGDLRAATSWRDLEARLASQGLRIERRGRGAVVTDGTHEAKLSSVSRSVSRSKLETRFGSLRDHERGRAPRPPAPPSKALALHAPGASSAEARRRATGALRRSSWQVARGARRVVRAIDLDGEPNGDERLARGVVRSVRGRAVRFAVHATRGAVAPALAQRSLAARAAHRDVRPGGRIDRLAGLVSERVRLARLEAQWGTVLGVQTRGQERAAAELQRLQTRAERTGEAFVKTLSGIYARPQAAAHAFAREAARDGSKAAAEKMATSPEAFGRLRPSGDRAPGLRGRVARVLRPSSSPSPALVARAAKAGTAYLHANAQYVGATSRDRSAGLGGSTRGAGVRAAERREDRIRSSLFLDKGGGSRKASARLDAQIGKAFDRIGRVPGHSVGVGRGVRSSVATASRSAERTARLAARVSRSAGARLGIVGLGVAATAARSVVRGLGR